MSDEMKLMEQVGTILIERSKEAVTVAREAVVKEQIQHTHLGDALNFFMKSWFDAAHPTLLSLTCEAVGGDPKATTDIAAAMVLLTGAADVHDDIIDKSKTKDSKPTVYGKYGKDIAIIVGDALWVRGMLMLDHACEAFPYAKKQAILQLTKQSIFNLASAETKETTFRRNLDLQPQEYLAMLKLKVSISEAAARIGAIIGDGTEQEIKNFAQLGENIALLMTIRDEFVDMFEPDELKNRFRNECLPLPILYAFADFEAKNKILNLLEKEDLSETDAQTIADLTVNVPQLRLLIDIINSLKEEVDKSLVTVNSNKSAFSLLLKSALINLPS